MRMNGAEPLVRCKSDAPCERMSFEEVVDSGHVVFSLGVMGHEDGQGKVEFLRCLVFVNAEHAWSGRVQGLSQGS